MLFLLAVLGCTEAEKVRVNGHTMTVNLPCDHKLIAIDWGPQGSDLWYASQEMQPGDHPRKTTFASPHSNGAVYVNESLCVDE